MDKNFNFERQNPSNNDLMKIMNNHINYLENKLLVFENVLDDFDKNKLPENFIEELESQYNESEFVENIQGTYYFYLKYIKEDFDKINFIMLLENDKIKKKLNKSQKNFNDYKYQLSLVNNDIGEAKKHTKSLEEKYVELKSRLNTKNTNYNSNFNNEILNSTKGGEFSIKQIIHDQKKEKEKRLKFLKNEIIKQEKLLLDNKKILEEKEKRNLYLTTENQHLNESIKQKSLIIEHIFSDANNNPLIKGFINESALSTRKPANLTVINQENNRNIDFDSKSCNGAFSSNTSKKKGFVGFFQNIFK